jgi:hypothetical protein
MTISDAELKQRQANIKGQISNAILKELVVFVEDLTVLSQEDKDALIEGLADWL